MSEEKQRIIELMDNLKSDKYPLDAYQSIGKRGIRRIDGYEKASGRAVYTIDLQLQGMLYAKFLTSPYANARIRSMDTAKAESYSGVRAVLRYDDPGLPEMANLGGHVPNLVTILPDTAYFQGEEVGVMLAADSEQIVDEALRLIDVDWEERPFVLDPEKAAEKSAPLVRTPSSTRMEITSTRDSSMLISTAMWNGDLRKPIKSWSSNPAERRNTWMGPERPCGVFHWNGEYPEVWIKHQHPLICKRAILLVWAFQ